MEPKTHTQEQTSTSFRNESITWSWKEKQKKSNSTRNEITLNEKLEFAKKLRKIDPFSGILDFLPAPKTCDDNDHSQQSEYNISHLSIMSQAKKYIEANVDNTSESNLSDVADEFIKVLTFFKQ